MTLLTSNEHGQDLSMHLPCISSQRSCALLTSTGVRLGPEANNLLWLLCFEKQICLLMISSRVTDKLKLTVYAACLERQKLLIAFDVVHLRFVLGTASG